MVSDKEEAVEVAEDDLDGIKEDGDKAVRFPVILGGAVIIVIASIIIGGCC